MPEYGNALFNCEEAGLSLAMAEAIEANAWSDPKYKQLIVSQLHDLGEIKRLELEYDAKRERWQKKLSDERANIERTVDRSLAFKAGNAGGKALDRSNAITK
jgi:hypothetical protein